MRTPFKLAIISAAVILTACSTAPTSTTLLDQTRSEYQTARNNPDVNRYAATELAQSAEALDKANAAATARENAEKVDKLAYLAKQQLAVTEDLAKQKAAEAVVANAEKQRNEIRLNERTIEVNKANANTAAANEAAANAQSDAQRAQNDAQRAQSDAQQAQARADRLEQELNELHAKKTDHGIVITFGDILFNTNESRLNPSGVAMVQKLATVLNENPQRTVLVSGFTDSTGTAAYNLQLSERRASAVSEILTGAGIAHQRITIKGYGEARPVADNSTAQNRQLNRRVEITLSDDTGNIVGAQ